jgi:hypothetical protein
VIDVGGYALECPGDWRDIEVRAADAGGIQFRAAIAGSLELKIIVWPGGGSTMIDSYFKTMIDRFDDGSLRGFDVEQWGIRFRGWLLSSSRKLSEHTGAFANFYGTVCNGDAVCWAWYSLGEPPGDPDAVEYLCLTVIGGALARKLPVSAG